MFFPTYPIFYNIVTMFRSVVWSKKNPEPWNTIKPDQSVKIINVNQKLDKRLVPLPSSIVSDELV